jgi:hypothetical protein
MMESLRIFQNGGDIVSPSSSAAMNASDLFHHNNNNNGGGGSAIKRRHSRNNYSDAGYDENSLLPYSSSPFNSSVGPTDEQDEDDLRIQLIQKEKDLILAAELGKALLEKNEELNEANEKMAAEFSKKLEVRKHHFLTFCILFFSKFNIV